MGDGPDLQRLKRENYHREDILFVGAQFGKELASWYAGADCFVFPSKTDTYGIVMIESLCCGTPIAGYNVTGPIDIVDREIFGSTFECLQYAVEDVLNCQSSEYAASRDQREKISQKEFTWKNCATIFANSLVPRS